MAEQLDLAAPVSVITSTYVVRYIGLDLAASRIVVELVSNQGGVLTKVYDGSTTPTGAALLNALNTSNNTTTSLVKHVYQRLIADGVVAGNISGTPQ
jgi:hypothetical protein